VLVPASPRSILEGTSAPSSLRFPAPLLHPVRYPARLCSMPDSTVSRHPAIAALVASGEWATLTTSQRARKLAEAHGHCTRTAYEVSQRFGRFGLCSCGSASSAHDY